MPVAILCATNLANSDVYAIPHILQADEKTRHISVIGVGDSQQSLLDAFRAGYDDFVERRIGAQEVARHLVEFLLGRRHSLQLTQAEDLSRVIQNIMLSEQTGALRVKAASSEGIIFFKTGEIIHAESASFIGDFAIRHMIEICCAGQHTCKFLRGCAIPAVRTVQDTVEELQG